MTSMQSVLLGKFGGKEWKYPNLKRIRTHASNFLDDSIRKNVMLPILPISRNVCWHRLLIWDIMDNNCQ